MLKLNTPPILIVGAGPTGLTLACFLSQHNIPFDIIDMRLTPSQITRAVGITATTVEIFKKLGLAEKLLRSGFQSKNIILYWNKRKLNRLSFDRPGLLGYQLYSTQPILENILIDHLREKNVEITRGLKLVSFVNESTGVQVKFMDEEGKIVCKKYDFLVGCDGNRSFVREQLNMVCDEEDYAGHFLLADVKMDWAESNQDSHYCLTEDGYVMILPLPLEGYRVIASFRSLPDEEKNVQFDVEKIQKIINARSHFTIKVKEIIWSTSSRYRHQISEKAFNSRVVLAGDAYHIFSPVGGTNMNFGNQDAECLANKFYNIIRLHQGFNQQFVEYEQERSVAIQKNLSITKQNTHLMIQHPKRDLEYQEKFIPRMQNRQFIRNFLSSLMF